MSRRFVCIHGHFYQPPRENAWTETLGRQPSARPHHDWNERITHECYGPNARARILGERDRIVDIVDNYASISFNVGPTLLSWLEANAPRVHRSIVESDRASMARFGGHGSAIAQAYNHMIMPLASDRDRRTQVRWGARDFEHRFGRKPEGMWLPETAVDTASLEALAAEGIRFTILSPRQAKTILAPGEKEPVAVDESKLDTERAYRVDLPSGKSIAVFFYDGGLSQAVAFERLLSDGAGFARRLVSAFKPSTAEEPRLVHIATDGETYGHHHRFGEMALAWAIRAIEKGTDARLTNYAEFLELAPPTHVATIVERSSWSCFHGVGRWSADCGCRMRGGSSQAWRAPLRAALDALRERLDAFFEKEAAALYADAWAARDAYIDVVLARTDEAAERFLAAQAKVPLDAPARVRALELMELQRFGMLMYTSCGWFFDDVDGLETTQILEYAARAIDLAHELGSGDLLGAFMNDLELARPGPNGPTGKKVLADRLGEARVDADRVAAHFAIGSLFESPEPFASAAHEVGVSSIDRTRWSTGESAVCSGIVSVRHRFTGKRAPRAFAVVRTEGPHFQGTTWEPPEGDGGATFFDALHRAGRAGAFDEARRLVESRPGHVFRSLSELLPDEQERVLDALLGTTLERIEGVMQEIHEECAPLLRFIAPLAVQPPKALVIASRVVLHAEIARQLAASSPDFDLLMQLVTVAREEDVKLELPEIELKARAVVERLASEVELGGGAAALGQLARAVEFALALFSTIDLSRAQDLVWALWAAHKNDPLAGALAVLGERLRLALPGAEALTSSARHDEVSG